MRSSIRFNINYIVIMFTYYIANACFGAFGNLFMVGRGLSESTIGLVFSISSILALFFQYLVSRIYKSFSSINTKILFLATSFLAIIFSVILALYSSQIHTIVFFSLAWAFALTLVPIMSSIYVEYSSVDYQTSFNVPRAFGSFSYALSSLFLGLIFSKNISSEYNGIIIIVSLLLSLIFALFLPNINIENYITEVTNKEKKEEIKEEYNKYSYERNNFIFILLGILFLLMMHNIVTSYMLQLMEAVGGDSSNVGLALAISAAVEVISLLSYSFFAEKFSHRRLLLLSAFGFFIKPIIIVLTMTVGGIYFAQFTQIIGFAIYVVAIIEYTNQIMSPEDAIKAQFDINIALTLGGIAGNIVGGNLIEYFGVPSTLVFGIITSFIGLGLFFIGLRTEKSVN